MYLLDTDHVSLMQRGGREGIAIARRLRTIPPDDYGTTIVTFEEQCRGWLDKINQARDSQSRLFAYAKFNEILNLFSGIAVIGYGASADAFVLAWDKAKIRVSTKDTRIAAIAMANDAVLLTRNARDFGRIPGLRIDDWSIPTGN